MNLQSVPRSLKGSTISSYEDVDQSGKYCYIRDEFPPQPRRSAVVEPYRYSIVDKSTKKKPSSSGKPLRAFQELSIGEDTMDDDYIGDDATGYSDLTIIDNVLYDDSSETARAGYPGSARTLPKKLGSPFIDHGCSGRSRNDSELERVRYHYGSIKKKYDDAWGTTVETNGVYSLEGACAHVQNAGLTELSPRPGANDNDVYQTGLIVENDNYDCLRTDNVSNDSNDIEFPPPIPLREPRTSEDSF